MKVLLVNPANDVSSTHSRKGMYVPLGLLSIATYALQQLGDRVAIEVIDEDVETLDLARLGGYDLVGFYATTFNYGTALGYAERAKKAGAKVCLGGPHPTAMAGSIMANRAFVDFVVVQEGEIPFVQLLRFLLGEPVSLAEVPNLHWRLDGRPQMPMRLHTNDLAVMPIPSRHFIDHQRYVENYWKVYPEHKGDVPGSLYSSKGCNWRDKTNGGCVFCARLESGLRFRPIAQIWDEILMLRAEHGVTTIWDISDDNLNDRDWFAAFVAARPKELADLKFFIYSRVSFIRPDMIETMKRLNVEEVFLGVESGDNDILKMAVKGQTVNGTRRAVRLLADAGMKYFPSFILGLPGETESSLKNTLDLCLELADMGGLDRIGATVLQPIPGSASYTRTIDWLRKSGQAITDEDKVDLPALERVWANNFTNVTHDVLVEYKDRINQALVGKVKVFGGQIRKVAEEG